MVALFFWKLLVAQLKMNTGSFGHKPPHLVMIFWNRVLMLVASKLILVDMWTASKEIAQLFSPCLF